MRSAITRFVLAGLLAPAIARGGGAPSVGPAPRLVSPGARDRPLAAASDCPTFSWGTPPAGRELELLVYEIAGGAAASAPVLRERLPVGSTAWTPSADRCLAPRRYAWTVRPVGDADRGVEVFVFVVPNRRNDLEADLAPSAGGAEPSTASPRAAAGGSATQSPAAEGASAGASRVTAAVSTPCGSFVDVDAADPFCPWILSAEVSNLMAACANDPDPRFCPTGPVTRQQLAKALASEDHLPQGCAVDSVPKWTGSEWACFLQQNVCGNGQVGEGEECDNGNIPPETQCPYGTVSCIACNACALVLLSGPYCGDGVLQLSNEQCEDGNSISEDSCPYGTAPCNICNSGCVLEPRSNGEVCGDAVTQLDHEDCDDGNTSSCGGCSPDCQIEQAPTAATGMIVVPASASLQDQETFSLDDGVGNQVVFEFDRLGNGVTQGVAVSVTGALTDTDVRDACVFAINDQGPLAITAGSLGAQIVTLVHDRLTAAGNVSISDTVASDGFVVFGMSGGLSGDCGPGVGCVMNSDCLSGFCDANVCAVP